MRRVGLCWPRRKFWNTAGLRKKKEEGEEGCGRLREVVFSMYTHKETSDQMCSTLVSVDPGSVCACANQEPHSYRRLKAVR